MVGSTHGGTPYVIIASARASWSAEGLSLRGTVSIATRPARPAALMASIQAALESFHSRIWARLVKTGTPGELGAAA